jgi:hypothetical protein
LVERWYINFLIFCIGLSSIWFGGIFPLIDGVDLCPHCCLGVDVIAIVDVEDLSGNLDDGSIIVVIGFAEGCLCIVIDCKLILCMHFDLLFP